MMSQIKINRKLLNREKTSKFTTIVICLFFVTMTCTSLFSMADAAPLELYYSFEFEDPNLAEHQLQNKDFTSLSVPGCMNIGTEIGAPIIPVKFITLMIPSGCEVTSVTATGVSNAVDTSECNLVFIPITPYQKPLPIGEKPEETNPIDFNNAIYTSDALYPSEILKNKAISYSRGYTILSLGLYPVQYSPGNGEIFFYDTLDVHIGLKDTGYTNEFFRGTSEDESWVQGLVDNPEIAQTYSGHDFGTPLYIGGLCNPSDNGGLGYDYVIICREALSDFTEEYTWTDFISRKATEGLETTIVTVEDILATTDYENADPLFNDEPARIREFCKDAYQDWGTDYILIAGDQEGTNRVERRLMDYDYEADVETDIYFSHLDSTFNEDGDINWGETGDAGFDLYTELFAGNLPCDDPVDISNWMKKSFFYADALDIDYLENAAFYGGDTGWNCQGDDFVDYSAIQGTNDWLGPDPDSSGPYPTWLGFQYGFETWNANNVGLEYNLSVKWTEESPNAGWQGGYGQGVQGLKNAINNDQCTLISAIAHANADMSMDVSASSWESDYHNTMPFFIHDYGCHCGDMNAANDGVLHSMLFHSDTELAFACVYNTGYGWGNYDSTNSSSAMQQKSFWDYIFDVVNNSGGTMNWQLGKAQEYARDLMAPTLDWDPGYATWRGIIESCLLFGDPAQLIKPPMSAEHNIGVQAIDVGNYVTPEVQTTIGTTIVNNGQNDESNIIVRFRVDGIEQESQTIPFMASQTVQTVSFDWTPALGSYVLTINATITGVIEEFYFDNEKSKLVIAGSDIAVSQLQAPDLLTQGEAQLVSGLIENLGLTSYSNILIQLIANDLLINSTTISLNGGTSSWISFSWDGTTSGIGIYNVTIYAVPVYNEVYFENQQLSQQVTVGITSLVFQDNFELDNGWTIESENGITGEWERGIPINDNRGDPPTDYDGSGQCYITGNSDDEDVDEGITWLISPTLLLDAQADARIDYALWYTNDYGNDPNNDLFLVHVSNDNGATWVLAQTIGPQSLTGWVEQSFLLSDVITPSDQVKVRFEASDLNTQAVVEAGIDAFYASIFDYSPQEPFLIYTPTFYDFGIMNVDETDMTTFELWNSGAFQLNYTLSESCDWVDIFPLIGNSSGEHDTISINVDTTGLAPGPYQCPVSIQSNGGTGVFSVSLYIPSGEEFLDVDQNLYDRGFPVRHASDGDWAAAQDFIPTISLLTHADIYLRKFGTPEFDLTVELREDHPQGTLVDTLVFTPAEVSSSWDWLSLDFADTTITPDVHYFIVCPPTPSGVTTSFGYEWAYAFGDLYDDGAFWFTRNGGGLWRDLPDTYEFCFRTYGYS